MKNIEAILKEFGIEVTAEQLTNINKAVSENYKTINDYNKQAEKVTTLETTVTETQEALKKFDGVNVEELNNQIKTLQTDMETKKAEYEQQIADRDFNDLIKSNIISAKGKDADKIAKLLDVNTLKESKNQEADIQAAIKALAEDDITKGMFGDSEPNPVGTGNTIGDIGKGGTVDADMAQMMAVMGLPMEGDK